MPLLLSSSSRQNHPPLPPRCLHHRCHSTPTSVGCRRIQRGRIAYSMTESIVVGRVEFTLDFPITHFGPGTKWLGERNKNTVAIRKRTVRSTSLIVSHMHGRYESEISGLVGSSSPPISFCSLLRGCLSAVLGYSQPTVTYRWLSYLAWSCSPGLYRYRRLGDRGGFLPSASNHANTDFLRNLIKFI